MLDLRSASKDLGIGRTVDDGSRSSEFAQVAFDDAWIELRRLRRSRSVLFGLAFAICLVISLYVGEVRLDTVLEGLPGWFD